MTKYTLEFEYISGLENMAKVMEHCFLQYLMNKENVWNIE